MTQEEKQLLLKDLSARLPYGVLVKCSDTEGILRYDSYRLHEMSEDGSYLALSAVDIPHGVSNLDLEFCDIKPYLRPMSSMTEEEKEELYHYYCKEIADNLSTPNLTWELKCCVSNSFGTDWLNEHYFDYRGLIEKGLALEAPEEMYKND